MGKSHDELLCGEQLIVSGNNHGGGEEGVGVWRVTVNLSLVGVSFAIDSVSLA